jgi:hypothetical protein
MGRNPEDIMTALPKSITGLAKPTRYMGVTETAKLIRQALKEAFPEIKFCVRSSKYAGGSSIDVSWEDGPTEHQVEAIAKAFQGGYFDGMTDYKGHHTHTMDGEPVSFGGDFVFCTRHVPAHKVEAAQKILREAQERLLAIEKKKANLSNRRATVSDAEYERIQFLLLERAKVAAAEQAQREAQREAEEASEKEARELAQEVHHGAPESRRRTSSRPSTATRTCAMPTSNATRDARGIVSRHNSA